MRCARVGGYQIRASGTLGPAGITHRPVTVLVSTNGGWRLRAGWPRDAKSLDFRGCIVAPGLYDAHVHLNDSSPLESFLSYGICRVRDLGSPYRMVTGIDGGLKCVGAPEVILGGPVLDSPGKPRIASALPWQSAEDLYRYIDAAGEHGVSWIKIYAGFPIRLLPTLVSYAHTKALKLAAHARPKDARLVIESGIDEFEHIVSLIGLTRTLSSQKITALYDAWASSPMRPAELEHLADLLSGTTLCPTLATHELLRNAAEYGSFPHEAPPDLIKNWRSLRILKQAWTADQVGAAKTALLHMADCLIHLAKLGVQLTIGSDTPNPGIVAGRGLWDEINNLINAGFTPPEAYLMASVAPTGMPAGQGEGVHDLTFLPVADGYPADDDSAWPVVPVAGILRVGCLWAVSGWPRPITAEEEMG